MSQQSARDVARRLFSEGAPPPPDGLAESIKSAIPEVRVLASMASQGPQGRRSTWLVALAAVAASVVLVLGAGLLALGLAGRETSREEPAGRAGRTTETPVHEPVVAGSRAPAGTERETDDSGFEGADGESRRVAGPTGPEALGAPAPEAAADPYPPQVPVVTPPVRDIQTAPAVVAPVPPPDPPPGGTRVVQSRERQQTAPRPTPRPWPRTGRRTDHRRPEVAPPSRAPAATRGARTTETRPTEGPGVLVVPVPVVVAQAPRPVHEDSESGARRRQGDAHAHNPSAEWAEDAGWAVTSPRFVTEEIPLEVKLGSRITAADYADRYLWVATDEPRLWRFDMSGRAEEFDLPSGGKRVRSLWSHGRTATLFLEGRLLNVRLSGELSVVRWVEPFANHAVWVRGGSVSLANLSEEGLDGYYFVHRGTEGRREMLAVLARRDPGFDFDSREQPPAAYPVSLRNGPLIDTVLLGGYQTPFIRSAEYGILARIDGRRVAYVTHMPYEVWMLGVDGSIEHEVVDESRVRRPEESSPQLPPGGERLRIGFRHSRKARMHEGRLVVNRLYTQHYRMSADYEALSEGQELVTKFHMLDFVDLDTGRVEERIDTTTIENANLWVGFEGDSLVFLHYGPGEHRLVLARRRE